VRATESLRWKGFAVDTFASDRFGSGGIAGIQVVYTLEIFISLSYEYLHGINMMPMKRKERNYRLWSWCFLQGKENKSPVRGFCTGLLDLAFLQSTLRKCGQFPYFCGRINIFWLIFAFSSEVVDIMDDWQGQNIAVMLTFSYKNVFIWQAGFCLGSAERWTDGAKPPTCMPEWGKNLTLSLLKCHPWPSKSPAAGDVFKMIN
jgi:hypothetical protein